MQTAGNLADESPAQRRVEAGSSSSSSSTATVAGVATPFSHRLRVYWEDTDAGGVVFYANYLKFFERARTEWLRAMGVGQQALRDATGAIFVVAGTSVQYRRPARLDDVIDVTVDVQSAGRASLVIAQRARRGAELLAEGDIRIGCVDVATFRPARIPDAVIRALQQQGPR